MRVSVEHDDDTLVRSEKKKSVLEIRMRGKFKGFFIIKKK